ncbi:hypothetical protein ACIQGZ_16535 [Streptomyces sp. NPDC092296]|uniref:hypothetical protein n=1 Tax=Streptomyces sp. NPDC092296 TaxID=3366012 RepID=UPI0037F18EF5
MSKRMTRLIATAALAAAATVVPLAGSASATSYGDGGFGRDGGRHFSRHHHHHHHHGHRWGWGREDRGFDRGRRGFDRGFDRGDRGFGFDRGGLFGGGLFGGGYGRNVTIIF